VRSFCVLDQEESLEGKLELLFEVYDIDGNDTLSIGELSQLLRGDGGSDRRKLNGKRPAGKKGIPDSDVETVWATIRHTVHQQTRRVETDSEKYWMVPSRSAGLSRAELLRAVNEIPSVSEFFNRSLNQSLREEPSKVPIEFAFRLRELRSMTSRPEKGSRGSIFSRGNTFELGMSVSGEAGEALPSIGGVRASEPARPPHTSAGRLTKSATAAALMAPNADRRAEVGGLPDVEEIKAQAKQRLSTTSPSLPQLKEQQRSSTATRGSERRRSSSQLTIARLSAAETGDGDPFRQDKTRRVSNMSVEATRGSMRRRSQQQPWPWNVLQNLADE